jgi:hypothetical protein
MRSKAPVSVNLDPDRPERKQTRRQREKGRLRLRAFFPAIDSRTYDFLLRNLFFKIWFLRDYFQPAAVVGE